MKKLNLLLSFVIVIITTSSCKKSNDAGPLDGGSINVTNAVVGAPRFNMMTKNSVVSDDNTISSNNYAIMPVRSGQITLNFGTPPVAASATAPAVAAVVFYTQNLTVNNTSRYSLFLTGTSTSSIDNVLIKESYIQTYADSVCGVRFINLAPDTQPISVNILGGTNGSEASSLAYKAYGDFKQYPAKSALPNYTFEFRDVATGDLIASYTMNTPYFHNVTLCLSGAAGNYNVIQDNDY